MNKVIFELDYKISDKDIIIYSCKGHYLARFEQFLLNSCI